MRRVLTKSLNLGMAAGFVLIFLCCMTPLFRGAGFFIIMVPVIFLAGVFLWKFVAKMSKGACVAVFFVSLAVWGFLVFLLGVALEQVPAWDFGRVQRGAWELIRNGSFTDPSTIDYFLSIPNNFFVTVYIYRWLSMLMGIGMHPADAALLLNTLSLALSVVFIFLSFNCRERPQQGLFTAFYCFLFAPMLLYASVYYTDTLSMPFVCAVLYFALKAASCKNWLTKLLCGFLTGLFAGIGYLIKASPAIAMIAVLLFALLSFGRKTVSFSAAVLAVFALVAVSWQVFCHNNTLLPFPDEPYPGRLTASHYIMMGLYKNGGYSEEDRAFSSAIPTLEERRAENLRVIGERIDGYGFFGMFKHLRSKIVFTWADGGYYAPRKIAMEPISSSSLLDYLAYGARYYDRTASVLAASQILLLFLLAFGAISNAMRKKPEADMLFAARLAVFGLALFLLVWETRSRYLVNYAPLLALLASNEIICLSSYKLTGFKKKRDKSGIIKAATNGR